MSVALPSSETSRKHIAKQLALCLLLIFTPALTTYAGERWSFTVIPPAPANCPQCQVTPITVGPYPCNTGAGCCLDWWGSAEYRYKQECGSPPLPKCVITGTGYAYPGTLVTSGADSYCWEATKGSIPTLRWGLLWYPTDASGRVVYTKGDYSTCEKVRRRKQSAGDGTAANNCFATGNTE